MSTEIEQRVVQMKFDNKEFEANTKKTLSTLDTLKQKLQFDKVQDSFKNITTAAKNVDMSAISTAVDATRFKFSTLEVVAITALSNITNSVMNTGKRMLSSFTIDPITDGFSEYELKMNSVQTIMASTGADIDTVNKYLEELNEYSDKTIYSFSDMTESIGKFTNAGVSLDDAVMAIKGISNEAAISGANANEASRAMYNFAQALSSGAVKLIDWKSIELANMATKEFKQQLIDSALAMGTIVQVGDKYQSTTTDNTGKVSDLFDATDKFNDSLSAQWMTTDVLVSTLKEYADETTDIGKKAFAAAQDVKTFTQMMDALKEASGSGWAATWEILIGDLEEAKVFYTNINNVLSGIIGKMSESRNNLLRGWKDMGGRDNLIKGLGTLFTNLGKILKAIGDAFREVFPPTTAEQLYKITSGFTELIEKLTFGEKTINGIKNIFKGLFSVLKIFVELIKIPLKFIPPLLSVLSLLSEIVLRVAGVFGKVNSKIVDFVTSGDLINKGIDLMISIFSKAISKVKEFVDNFDLSKTRIYMEKLYPVIDMVKNKAVEMSSKVITAFKEMDWAAAKSTLKDSVNAVGDWFTNAYNTIKTKLGNIVNAVKDFLANVDWGEVFKFFTGVVASKVFLDIASFLKKLGDALESVATFTKPITKITDGVVDILESVKDTFESYQKTLKAEALKKLAIAIGLIAGSIWLLSKIEPDRLVPALAGMAGIMTALSLTMISLNKWGADGVKSLFSMGAAVLLLATAVKVLASIDTVKMVIGLGGLVGIIISVTAYAAVMKKSNGDLTISALSLIGFATAVLILTQAVKQLTDIQPKNLAVAVSGIVALTTTVALSSKILSKLKTEKGTFKILSFALAIKQLAKAVNLLKDLSWEQLGKGLFGVGMLIAEFAMFCEIIDEAQTLNGAMSMMIIAGALTAMIVPLMIFSKIGWVTAIDGLTKVALILASLGGVLHLMPDNMDSIALGLIGISGALVIMSGALKIMSTLSFGEMSVALYGLGFSLAYLAIALESMKDTVSGAKSLMVASVALIALSVALGMLGSLKLGTILKGLIAMGGALAVLALGVTALAPVSYVLTGLATTMLAFSGSLILAGVGLTLIGASLVSLAVGLTAFGGMVVGAISTVLTAIELLFLGFVKIAPSIAKGLAALLVAGIEGMAEVIPALVKGIIKILSEVFEALANNSEQIISNFVKFLISVIRGISMHLPELVEEVVNLFVTLLTSVVDALKKIDFNSMMKAVIGAGVFAIFLAGISALAPLIPTAAGALVGFTALVLEIIAILTLMGAIALIPGIDSLLSGGSNILEQVGVAIGRFLGGIIGGFAQGATSVLPTIGEHLSGFMTNAKPFFDGLSNVDESSMDSIFTLTKAVTLLTASSFVDSIASFLSGGSPLTKFGEKLAEFAPYYRTYADIMSGVNSSSLEQTSNAVKTLAEFAKLVPSQNGLKSAILGDQSIVEFGKELADFAPYFKEYANSVNGINADTITATSSAIESIMKFAKLVPNQGGLVSLFAGENSIATFGEELVEFGKGISKYSKSVEGVKPEAVEASATAASAMAELAKLVPNKGGLVALLIGDNSLTTLANELTDFGPALTAYSNSVVGVKVDNVKNSVDAASHLIDLIKKLPTGDLRLKEFGENLDVFGESVHKYANKVSTIDTSGMGDILDSIVDVVDISKTMHSFDPSKMSEFAQGMVDSIQTILGASAKSIETGLSNYISVGYTLMKNISIGLDKGRGLIQNGMSSIMNSAMSAQSEPAMTAMKSIIDTVIGTVTLNFTRLSDAGKNVIGFVNFGIESKTSTVTTNISNIIKNILSELSRSKTRMFNSGADMIFNLANGLRSRNSLIIQAGAQISNLISSTIRRGYNSMYNAGSYLVSGLSYGIRENSYTAVSAARDLANRVASETRTALDIHSPSRVFEEIGMFVDQGLANGLLKYSRVATNAADLVGNDTVDSMKSIISSIAIDELDTTPVIRPVIDLSDVESGASMMNSLFGSNKQLAINASISSARKASSTMRGYNNGSDSAIISAISDLKKTIANAGGNTYNTIQGITYDDNSNISNAVKDIVRAAKMGRRI